MDLPLNPDKPYQRGGNNAGHHGGWYNRDEVLEFSLWCLSNWMGGEQSEGSPDYTVDFDGFDYDWIDIHPPIYEPDEEWEPIPPWVFDDDDEYYRKDMAKVIPVLNNYSYTGTNTALKLSMDNCSYREILAYASVVRAPWEAQGFTHGYRTCREEYGLSRESSILVASQFNIPLSKQSGYVRRHDKAKHSLFCSHYLGGRLEGFMDRAEEYMEEYGPVRESGDTMGSGEYLLVGNYEDTHYLSMPQICDQELTKLIDFIKRIKAHEKSTGSSIAA